MTGRAFFDTNILLYMYDRRDETKRRKSADAFRAALESRTLVISTQVLQEFYVSVTRKLGLAALEARALLSDLCELPLVLVAASDILRAVQLEGKYRIAFWDALILGAAETAGAAILYTEDFTHGRVYGQIRAVNPFVD